MSFSGYGPVARLKAIKLRNLADSIGWTSYQLETWLDRGDDRFHPAKVVVCKGKSRILDVPKFRDKAVMKRLNSSLQSWKLAHKNAFGGVKGRSACGSARKHLGKPYIWTIDIKDCFPSISADFYAAQLDRLDLSVPVVSMWLALFIARGRLPQGSPLSNVGLNIAMLHFDYLVSKWCGSRRLAFSRMADDIVVSGTKYEDGQLVVDRITDWLKSSGHTINLNKLKEKGLQAHPHPQLVHSLLVGRGRVEICDPHREVANDLAERLVKMARCVQPSSLLAVSLVRNSLSGWYYYCRQTADPICKTLKRSLNEADLRVVRKLQSQRVYCPKNLWWLTPYTKQLVKDWEKRSKLPLTHAS